MTQNKIILLDICREYRKKFPDLPTKTLSRKIYNENNNHLVFTDSESIRTMLRHIEGKTGDKNRKTMKDKTFFKEEPRPMNPYKLPESDAVKTDKFILPEGKMGIISDIHVPFHDVEALTLVIDYLKAQNITSLLLNGDLFDFYGASRFLKDPRKRRIHEEIEIGCELLRVLKRELNCEIFFKVGNHDERLEHYLWQKVIEIPQLMDLQEIKDLTLEKILRKRLDFDFIDSKQFMSFCGLTIAHGHEARQMFVPVNPARGAFTKFKASILISHHHQTSSHAEKTVNDELIVTHSIGCLCELKPDYVPMNNYSHGFAVVNGAGTEYHVQNLRIIKGKIY